MVHYLLLYPMVGLSISSCGVKSCDLPVLLYTTNHLALPLSKSDLENLGASSPQYLEYYQVATKHVVVVVVVYAWNFLA